MADSRSGRRKTAAGKRITKGTIEQYEMSFQLLQFFEACTNKPLRLTLLHRSSLKQIQQEKNYWEKFFLQFSDFVFTQTNCCDNYAANIFKVIKTFWNYLLVERSLPIGQFHRKFRVPQHIFNPVVLSPAQLSFLINDFDFNQSLAAKLIRTKDIFVVGCTLGLRYGDLMRLKKNNLQCTNEGNFIVLHTGKTATELRIPVPEYVTAILKKKQYKKGKFLLPQLSGTNVNLQIKELMEKAGWVYSLPRIRYRKGRPIEILKRQKQSYRFCDHITAHTMRRTAITTLLMLGVPENVVRRISGHSAGSKEFYRYVAIIQDYLNEKVNAAHEQLEKMHKP